MATDEIKAQLFKSLDKDDIPIIRKESTDFFSLDELVKLYARKRYKKSVMALIKRPKGFYEIRYPWEPEFKHLEWVLESTKHQLMYYSTFNNESCESQSFTYTSGIKDTWSCQMSFKEGCKMSANIEVDLNLHKFLSVKGTLGQVISLQEEEQQVYGGEVEHQIGASVNVPAGSSVTAAVIVRQEKYSSKCEINCRMEGNVSVILKDAKSKEEIKAGDYDIENIIEYAIKKKVVTGDHFTRDAEGVPMTCLVGTFELSINSAEVTLTNTPLTKCQETQVTDLQP